jgi:hypothetical protein
VDGIAVEYGVALRQLTETIASGNGSRTDATVEQITGTVPGAFCDFARKNAAAWSEDSK